MGDSVSACYRSSASDSLTRTPSSDCPSRLRPPPSVFCHSTGHRPPAKAASVMRQHAPDQLTRVKGKRGGVHIEVIMRAARVCQLDIDIAPARDIKRSGKSVIARQLVVRDRCGLQHMIDADPG